MLLLILGTGSLITVEVEAQQVYFPSNDTKAKEQEKQTQRSSIIEFLETPKLGQGSIRIYQSPAIRALVKLRPNTLSSADITGGYTTLSGFKVQVYSGNAANSKSVAQQRSALVEEAFPDLETELQYKAPFWRVRAGNFITQAEAQEYLNALKKEFPRFGKEMYVVRATIKIPR